MEKGAPFLGASKDYTASKKVIIGAPMDWTVSFRPGSRFGPASIRDVSPGLEEYSVYQDKSLADVAFYDAGDLALPFGNPGASLDLIKEAVSLLHADGKVPLLLGGEHLVSWPAIAAAHSVYPDLVVIHLDAHADLRSDYLGESLSHASVIRRVCELVPEVEVYQFGIRSGEGAEFIYARERTRLFPFKVLEPLRKVLPELKGRPVYLTLDIDVADPAFAPGTGTPEPGGVTSSELIEAITLFSECRLIGADIVEVAPDYDLSRRTPFLAAKLLREILLF
ncbi:MAG: agmatinase [Firmicutes bacterium]|nr:agmatinase [Bacillota bacterium]